MLNYGSMQRWCIKIVGESGAGLLSTGDIIIKSFKELGFYVVADREYPSLIKGGYACFIINVSPEPIFSLSEKVDVMLAIDKQSLHAYHKELRDNGLLIYGYERPLGVKEIVAKSQERGVQVVHQMARDIAYENGGSVLMTNVVLVGMFWKVLGLPYEVVEAAVTEKFKSKPKILEIDLKCLKAGFESVNSLIQMEIPKKNPSLNGHKKILIDGNKALAAGAVHGGCRAYYAYPMSPSSTILTWMAEWAKKTGMLVKQVEDEISVINMTLGSMFMGTRALCATSGGGYDLMTETVSLAGMIETPLVVVVAQRPGPATGLPTWTAQGDLNLAIYSSHGEFSRIVIGVSEPKDCFELIQHAFNLAEKYQTVVIVLTEKAVAETHMAMDLFEQGNIPIERGLIAGEEMAELKGTDRFKVTASGLSKRWLPGSSESHYFANGDEHWEDGSLTELGDQTQKMYEKRMKKVKLIEKALPEPEIFGVKKDADISFVGWGSSANVMKDTIRAFEKEGIKVNYLHYSYVYPLKTAVAEKFFEENANVNLIEGNYQGQFGDLLEAKLGRKFQDRLLKYNGRSFFVEDVEKFVRAKVGEKILVTK